MPEVGGGHVAGARDRPQVIPLSKLVPEIRRHRDMRGEIGLVDDARFTAVLEKTVHQRDVAAGADGQVRSEEHTSELQSLMRISYAVFCLKNKNKTITSNTHEDR